MSVEIQTVEFERREAYLSELEDGPPWTVHGVALGAGDVTVGQSGIKKLWPEEELKESADSLEGRNLVVDHNNDSSGVVGQVTKAGYKDGVGVIYEAELFEEELAEKISNGLLEVSIRGKHTDVEQMEETDDGAKVVEDIVFDNLSIVPTGAAPSNTIDMGEAEELSLAELSAFTDSLEVEELQEIEPGMWVTDGDMHGITISQVEDGEIEVDVYEESDDKWRSTGETKMVSTDDLEEWDVDEEEDIGARQDESDEEENAVTTGDVPADSADPEHEAINAAEGDKVQWDSSGGLARGVVVDRQQEGCFEDEIDGDVKVCAEEGDPALLINVVQKENDKWKKSGTMVAHKESTVEETDFSMLSKHKMDEDVEDDKESETAPQWKEGDLVQWQVEPQLFGKIVHVDEKRHIVMVEIHERMDGELESTGFTISAGFSDLSPLRDSVESREEEMDELEESYTDYPEAAKENAQMALDARKDTDNPNDCGTSVGWKRANQLARGKPLTRDVIAKMAAFNRHRQNSDMSDEEGEADCGWMMWKAWGGDEGVDWAQRKLDEIEEENGASLSGVEGEEDEVTSDAGKEEIRKQSPERFPDDADVNEQLQDYEMHTPDWSGTTEGEWSSPDMEDFDTDDLSEIASHFLISSTGFPPENFTDLKLPVVEPNGDLNVNALAAVKGGRGVSAVDGLGSDMEDEIVDWVNSTANEEFDREWGMDEEEAGYGKRSRTIDDTGKEANVENTGPVDCALDLINKYLRLEGKHERDSVDKMLSWLFGSTDLPMETVSDFRTAANAFLDQTAGTDSFDGMTVEQFRDWLLMHGDGSQGRREQDVQERGELPPGSATPVHVLTGDDLQQGYKSEESELDDTTKVTIMTNEDIEQKLAELSEPVAVEQSDLEELRQKADRFEEMSETLESLKERTDILDDVDRAQVEELAESDEPVVVESARMESLEGEAEQVKEVYAAALSEEMDAFSAEELAERFDIDELREKYEDQIGDPAEELAGSEEADPKSGDVDEEELEERAEEDQLSDSEVQEQEEAQEMRAELKEKIVGRN
jgi:hypothetical protein